MKHHFLTVRWQKRLFGFLPEGLACGVGAKANVPFAGRHKITRLLNLSLSGARESLRLFELKKMCGGEIKNTEGLAMSVGLLVVRLKYGLYDCHLSK